MALKLGEEAHEFDILLDGYFQRPDRSQVTMTMRLPGVSIELEFIAIGTESYMKEPFSSVWLANPESPVPFWDPPALFQCRPKPETVAEFVMVGEEELDGEPVFHLKGSLSGDALANALDDERYQSVPGAGEFEYWIGLGDFLVRKTEMRIEVSPSEEEENLFPGVWSVAGKSGNAVRLRQAGEHRGANYR